MQAIIDKDKCKPENCTGGICFVRKNCPVKAIVQMDPYDIPMTDTMRCHGCSKCLAHCPLKAISLV